MKKILSIILIAVFGLGYIGLIGYFGFYVEKVGGIIAFCGICFGIGAIVELNEKKYSKR